MQTAWTVTISVGATIAAWLAVMLPLYILGYATGLMGFCPQAPDWWIETYSIISYFTFWLIAPAFALYVGFRVFRRRWVRARVTVQ